MTTEKEATKSKWQVRQLRLDKNGYDRFGSYWGAGQPLFECFNDSETSFFRAASRDHAIEQLLDERKPETLFFYRGPTRGN